MPQKKSPAATYTKAKPPTTPKGITRKRRSAPEAKSLSPPIWRKRSKANPDMELSDLKRNEIKLGQRYIFTWGAMGTVLQEYCTTADCDAMVKRNGLCWNVVPHTQGEEMSMKLFFRDATITDGDYSMKVTLPANQIYEHNAISWAYPNLEDAPLMVDSDTCEEEFWAAIIDKRCSATIHEFRGKFYLSNVALYQ